jgi:hypothetical protein
VPVHSELIAPCGCLPSFNRNTSRIKSKFQQNGRNENKFCQDGGLKYFHLPKRTSAGDARAGYANRMSLRSFKPRMPPGNY